MVLIGIDPHKSSHTAVVVDGDEKELARLKVRADRRQLQRLLAFAQPYEFRTWAIESAGGLGFLLAQQLVAAGEDVVDVPPVLAARVRLLGSGRGSKNDPNDALSTAIAALRDPHLRTVTAENHVMVLRLLADRHQDLTALRTQAVGRLHALLAALVPGGVQKRLSANGASEFLRRVHPVTAVEMQRKALAADSRLFGKVTPGPTETNPFDLNPPRGQIAMPATGTATLLTTKRLRSRSIRACRSIPPRRPRSRLIRSPGPDRS
jgi:transposase